MPTVSTELLWCFGGMLGGAGVVTLAWVLTSKATHVEDQRELREAFERERRAP